MDRDQSAGRYDGTESVVTAAARAWDRVPRATRCKFAPRPHLTKRIWEGLLYHVVRETDPELRPVVRHALRGELTAAQAERLVAAIVGQSPRLDRAGEWAQGLKAAREEVKRLRAAAGLPAPPAVALLSHRVLPEAWARSAAERAVDADECLRLFHEFVHDDPDTPPPTHAAFKALFAREEAVRAMEDILAGPGPAAAAAGDPAAVREAEALLLDAPAGADWERLWARYTLLRPWQRHLTAVHMTGLSRHAVPTRPAVLEEARDRTDDTEDTDDTGGTGDGADAVAAPGDGPQDPLAPGAQEERDWAGEILGRSEGMVLPLDRSVWRRLDHGVRTLGADPGAAGLTAREVAYDEARRALEPLGLADDERRAVLCLGMVCLPAIGAEHAAVLLARRAATPRMLTELAELTERRRFVDATLRLGAAQHAPVRRALEDPLPGCTRLLWRMLHGAEVRQEDPPEPQERWARLIRTAASRYLKVLGGALKEVLDGDVTLEAEQPAGDALTGLADGLVTGGGSGPVAHRGPQTDQIVVDVIIDGQAQRGVTGSALEDWIRRLVDPLHRSWAEPAWDELYAEYRLKHQGDDGPVPFPPIPFESARDIVRSLYRPEAAAGGTR
jgi:hypothetical protein